MVKQRTLKNLIRATGIGVHTGKKVYITLRPAPVNTGVIFRRVDLDPVVDIPALAENVGPEYRECLEKGRLRILAAAVELAPSELGQAAMDVSAARQSHRPGVSRPVPGQRSTPWRAREIKKGCLTF